MIEYRKADSSDVELLTKIRMEFSSEVHGISVVELGDALYENNRQCIADSLSDGSFVSWLAADGGRIVGTSGVTFYTLLPNRSNPTGKTAYVSNMFTYPEYRGRGIASRLLELVVDEARERGCGKVILNATDMGRPVYEKFGFTDIANDMVYRVTDLTPLR